MLSFLTPCERYATHQCFVKYVSYDSQNWTGLFHGPFVLQTFAVHVSAIDRAKQVPDLHKKPTHMIGGLALSAGLVSYMVCLLYFTNTVARLRALLLIATQTIMIAMVCTARGKVIPLPWLFNHATDKESTCLTGFNNTAWGGDTCSYVKSAHKLESTRFEKIPKRAKPFVVIKGNCARKAALSAEVIEIDDNDEDEQACLVDANLDNEYK